MYYIFSMLHCLFWRFCLFSSIFLQFWFPVNAGHEFRLLSFLFEVVGPTMWVDLKDADSRIMACNFLTNFMATFLEAIFRVDSGHHANLHASLKYDPELKRITAMYSINFYFTSILSSCDRSSRMILDTMPA